MASSEHYRAPAAESRAELREKGSRFLAIIRPVQSAAAAREQIKELRRQYADSTHVCWAWRVGRPSREGCSDAGEPAGTAGTPMLQVLRGSQLSDVLAVVVRWFGGVKLGKGGLARAYSSATRLAIDEIRIANHYPTVEWVVTLPFERLGDLKRLIRPPAVEMVGETYEDSVTVRLRVFESHAEQVQEALIAYGFDLQLSEVNGS